MPVYLLLAGKNICNMTEVTEKACLCALNRIFVYEPRIALALIEGLGSGRAVFALSQKDIAGILGTGSPYAGMLTAKAVEQSQEELERLHSCGISFTGYTEDGYPPLLKECPDAPVGLYICGCTPARELWKCQSVAVIGTRDLSLYGKEWCTRIIRGISRCTPETSIVSGLALGTDICAHRNALECGLPTIAVMAPGPDIVYPHRHRQEAERIKNTRGCALVTDFPPGSAPLAQNFLRRNRIIAGLSRATILVESKIRGGGMSTARTAFSYNRDVYALPGRIDDIRSQGCNALIAGKTAESILSVSSLTKALGLSESTPTGNTDGERTNLKEAYRGQIPQTRIEMMTEMLLEIRHNRGITIEQMAVMKGWEYKDAASIASMLETDGLISIDLMQRCSIESKND